MQRKIDLTGQSFLIPSESKVCFFKKDDDWYISLIGNELAVFKIRTVDDDIFTNPPCFHYEVKIDRLPSKNEKTIVIDLYDVDLISAHIA